MVDPYILSLALAFVVTYTGMGWFVVGRVNSEHRVGMVAFLAIFLAVFVFEVATGRDCTLNRCSLNVKYPPIENGRDLACFERERVRWRFSFLLAGTFFLVLVSLRQTPMKWNVFYFFLLFVLLYVADNFRSYHDAGSLCPSHKSCSP